MARIAGCLLLILAVLCVSIAIGPVPFLDSFFGNAQNSVKTDFGAWAIGASIVAGGLMALNGEGGSQVIG